MEGKTVLDEDADIYRHPDEDLTEKEKLSRMGWKERWQYFCDYYGKVVLVIGLLALSIVCICLAKPTPSTETVLYVGFVNEEIHQEKKEELYTKLADVLSFDPEKESVLFDYTLFIEENPGYLTQSTVTVLIEQFYTGNMDLFVAPKDVYETYKEQGAFAKLEDVFSEEELLELSQYMYDDYSYSLKDSETYHSFASQEAPVIAVCQNAKRLERGKTFIKYMLEN